MTEPVGHQTLAPLLRGEAVAWETLEERYGALLKLVEVLLGVVPNCDPYLEIWPPAFRELAAAHGVDPDKTSADPRSAAALLLARPASPSPAEIDAGVVSACRDSGLPTAAIVELVTWLAVLQTLHRLSCFYGQVPQPV